MYTAPTSVRSAVTPPPPGLTRRTGPSPPVARGSRPPVRGQLHGRAAGTAFAATALCVPGGGGGGRPHQPRLGGAAPPRRSRAWLAAARRLGTHAPTARDHRRTTTAPAPPSAASAVPRPRSVVRGDAVARRRPSSPRSVRLCRHRSPPPSAVSPRLRHPTSAAPLLHAAVAVVDTRVASWTAARAARGRSAPASLPLSVCSLPVATARSYLLCHLPLPSP